MFRPAKMLRIRLLILRRHERTVMRGLGELGVVELRRSEPLAGEAVVKVPSVEKRAADCEGLLARVTELRRALKIHEPAASVLSQGEVNLAQAANEITRWERDAAKFLQKRDGLVQRETALNVEADQLAGYRDTDVPLGGPDRFAFLHFVTGSLPLESMPTLQDQAGAEVALLALEERKGRRTLIAMTTRRQRARLENALVSLGFEEQELPVRETLTASALWARNECDRENLAREIEQHEAAMASFVSEARRPLAEMESALLGERQLVAAENTASHSESIALVSGWLPAADLPAVTRRLTGITGGQHVVQALSAGGVPAEEVPVHLDQPRWLQPFVQLVSAYGLPKYGELVPTLFFALSYVLMFGAMFGDAGHGAILMIVAAMLCCVRRAVRWRKAAPLLWAAGLSSVGFGVVYGSYFGLPQLRHLALWHDPLEGNPMMLLFVAMGLGVLMISLGLVLNILNHVHHGDWREAICGRFGLAGLSFYWAALAWLTVPGLRDSGGRMLVALVLFLGVPVVVWLLREPLESALHQRAGKPVQGNLLGMAMESVVGVFETVLSYLANTISFVRLAAYAMSHAALLVAAFLLADEVRRLPAVGEGLGVVVVVLGNLLAIALEGIVAAVQALRLEYYEFFGKFFSGEGKAFRPFRLAAEDRAAFGSVGRGAVENPV